jgi:hypothetical protein
MVIAKDERKGRRHGFSLESGPRFGLDLRLERDEFSLAKPDQSHRQLVRFGETRFQELRGDLL